MADEKGRPGERCQGEAKWSTRDDAKARARPGALTSASEGSPPSTKGPGATPETFPPSDMLLALSAPPGIAGGPTDMSIPLRLRESASPGSIPWEAWPTVMPPARRGTLGMSSCSCGGANDHPMEGGGGGR